MSAIEKIIADMYCGGGGASQGLYEACEEEGIKYQLYAFNHDPVAIETHKRNHPKADHYCADLNSVNPRQVIPGRKLDALIAGPECTFYSNAAGGRPINEQSRASAWRVVEWSSQIEIDEILMENVPEFQKWGPTKKKRIEREMAFYLPLQPFDQWFEKMQRKGGTQREWRRIYNILAKLPENAQKKRQKVKLKVTLTGLVPIKEREGEIYIAFLKALESLGYKVEARVLKAADYGDATTRERLFIRATKKRRRIVWPEPTHAPVKIARSNSNRTLFDLRGDLQPYRPTREIIDWSIPGESIFTRKKPLSPNTLARIWKGLQKFSGLPFIVPQLSGGANRDLDQPLPTITTTSRGIGLCQPFIVELRGGQDARSIDDPLSTITTKGMHHGLCQPFIVVLRNHNDPKSIEEPLDTICANGQHHALCQPFIIRYNGSHEGRGDGAGRSQGIDEPLSTLDTSNRFGLVQPFIIGAGGPQGAGAQRSIDLPLGTVLTDDHKALVQPFLVKYNGTGGAQSLNEPLDTVTTRDRFGFVNGEVKQQGTILVLDILFRMLEPHELAAAHSFPPKYFDFGNREQKVKMIGNAWPVKMGKALCKTILTGR